MKRTPEGAKKPEFNLRLSTFTLCNFVFSWLVLKNVFLSAQNKGQLIFEDKWPSMQPVVLKLLLQDHVDST